MAYMKDLLYDLNEDGNIPTDWHSKVFPNNVSETSSSEPIDLEAVRQSHVDDDLDKLVDRCNIPYIQAMNEINGKTDEPEVLVDEPVGPSVKLGDRAIELASAIWTGNKYKSSVAYESILRIKVPKRDYEAAIVRTIGQEKLFKKQFDEAFCNAIGLRAIIAAGYDPDLAICDANTMTREFMETYLGPENKHPREKYKKILENYQK